MGVTNEFVDLNLSEFTHISNAFALEAPEVGGDARLLEVDDTGEGFVKETTRVSSGTAQTQQSSWNLTSQWKGLGSHELWPTNSQLRYQNGDNIPLTARV